MPYTRKLPRILPLPFRLAALARRRSGRGEGRGEGALCVVHPTVPSVIPLILSETSRDRPTCL